MNRFSKWLVQLKTFTEELTKKCRYILHTVYTIVANILNLDESFSDYFSTPSLSNSFSLCSPSVSHLTPSILSFLILCSLGNSIPLICPLSSHLYLIGALVRNVAHCDPFSLLADEAFILSLDLIPLFPQILVIPLFFCHPFLFYLTPLSLSHSLPLFKANTTPNFLEKVAFLIKHCGCRYTVVVLSIKRKKKKKKKNIITIHIKWCVSYESTIQSNFHEIMQEAMLTSDLYKFLLSITQMKGWV